MSENQRYRAFLSYSHADAKIAERLHKRWECFRIGKDLIGIDTPIGRVPDSLRPIFRDRGDFVPGTALSDATKETLKNSEALILLASPDAGRSVYVDAEIRLFRDLHPDRPVIPLILSGEPAEAFPPSLGPGTLAADWERDGHDLATAKVVAALLGLPPDLIFRRQKRQQQARRMLQALVGSVLLAALSGAGYWGWVSRQQAQVIATSQRTLDEVAALVRKYNPVGSAQAAEPGRSANLTEALTAIVEGAATNPKYAKALELLKAGKPDEAEPLLREAAQEMEARARQNGKQAAEAWRNLGAIAGLGDPKRALDAYAKAVELDPTNEDALAWAARLAFNAGFLDTSELYGQRLAALPEAKSDGEIAWQLRRLVGDIAQARGKLAEALKSYRDGSAVAARLNASDPANVAWQNDLGISNQRIGNVLFAQGSLVEALASYRAALTIAERLVKSDPDNVGWLRELSACHGSVGDVLGAQGNLPEALKSYRDSLTISERLAKSAPANAEWQANLSGSLIRVGNVLAAQGNLPEALNSYRDSLAISDRLARSDPRNATYQRDFAADEIRVGGVLLTQGKLSEALKAYQDSQAIFDRLARSDPGNAGWQHDLSVSDNRIGDVLKAQGNLPETLKLYRDSQAIFERLARSDPRNADWQRELFKMYHKIGDVLAEQRNLPEALKSYRDSLAIAEHLAKLDPSNAGAQRELSVSYQNIGDILLRLGDPPGGLKSYRDGFAISERLAKADPGNVEWQRDIANAHTRLALGYLMAKDVAQAREELAAGRTIAVDLVKRFPDSEQDKQNLAFIDKQFAALERLPGGRR